MNILILYLLIIFIIIYLLYRPNFTKEFYTEIDKFVNNEKPNQENNSKIKLTNCSNFVSTIYYINLDERNDREQLLLDNLNRYSFREIIRFPAVKNKIGAQGCFQSHLKLLEYLDKIKTKENIMIMEDDGYIKVDNIALDNVITNFSRKIADWDVLMLVCNKRDDFRGEKIYDNIWRIYRARVCTCYIVNKRYISRLKNFLNMVDKYAKKYGWKNIFIIDQITWKLQEKDKWYAIYPFPVGVRPNYSDIENKNVNYDACFV